MWLQESIQNCVVDALNHYSYTNAIFIAERFYAEVKNDDALFLLATCYYRAGNVSRAYCLLQNQGQRTALCKFLLARCCMDTNRLSEAESILAGNSFCKARSHDEIASDYGTSAPHVLSMLAYIYSKTERHLKARELYKKSLELNPLLWHSYIELCDMGEKFDANTVFKTPECESVAAVTDSKANASVAKTVVPQLCQRATPECQVTPRNECLNETPPNVLPDITLVPPSAPKSTRVKSRTINTFLSPSFGIIPLDMNTPSPDEPNHFGPLITPSPTTFADASNAAVRAPNKRPVTRRMDIEKQNSIISRPTVFSQSDTNLKDLTPSTVSINNNLANVRRSSRLFNSHSISVKENTKAPSKLKFLNPKIAGRKVNKSKFVKMVAAANEKVEDVSVMIRSVSSMPSSLPSQPTHPPLNSLATLLDLFKQLGDAYLALSQYRCQDAIELLSAVPSKQYETVWVQCQLAKAYFELNDYEKAVKIFEEVRYLDPANMDGMDVYSTALWHLQKDVQLSTLARDLTAINKLAPEVWCATGNCFSLQKEHDLAIKFLKRAIQVSPDFCYAHTLLAHEYVTTEELDKALVTFRGAIRCNPRHYNAWYGVGMIYYKQEKFGLAEVHFRKALSINPESSVLLCHIAVVQHALKKTDSALFTLDKAIATDPHNPLCKFHRATILFANDRNLQAIEELEELKQIVPKESLVYFLMGKVHKKLGNTHLALTNFSWAMDLDPKGANNQIKEAIDKRYMTEDDANTADNDNDLEESTMTEGGEPVVNASRNSSVLGDADVQLQAMESDDSL